MFIYPLLFGLAFVYSNLLEWVIHKYVFHGLGKKKKSPFSSHWHHHHRMVRKNDYVDSSYLGFPPHPSVTQEVGSLTLLSLIHLPLLFVSYFFYCSLLFFTCRYFYIHRRSHINPEWGKKNYPWHYDHHMGKNQNANWGVTSPFWDWILKTRIKYH